MQPLCLIAGFRRAQEIRRVIDVAMSSGLDVVVSLDQPREGDPKLVGDCEDVVRAVRSYRNLKDIWRYDSPLGCGRHLQTAIGRAFAEREEVIILEDDTLPSACFFEYCKKMLATYRDKPEVGMICGSRHVPRSLVEGRFLSHWPVIWGWAAWRRTWELYEPAFDLSKDNIHGVRNNLPPGFDDPFARWLSFSLEKIESGTLDTWDIQLAWSLLKHQKLSLYPSVNLVTNIGTPGKSASNKVSFDHSLFRPRYAHELSDNLPASASIRANQWHTRWLTPRKLFKLQANLEDPFQVVTDSGIFTGNSRELRVYYHYYLPLKIKCANLLKSLHIFDGVRKGLLWTMSLLRKCRRIIKRMSKNETRSGNR